MPAAAWWRRWATAHAATLITLAVYAVIVVAGLTTSSLGVGMLREDPAHPLGWEVGTPQTIRSDEFLTATPFLLGQIAAGESFTTNPLTQPPDLYHQIPSGPATALIFFEGTLTWLASPFPDAMVFAARWWLPTLLVVLFAPLWFREISGKRRFGYLCAALIVLAPSNTWWSYGAVAILGFVFAGCYLVFPLLRAVERRRWLPAAGLCLLLAAALARYPSFYQPFAIVIGLPVIAATVLAVAQRPSSWRVKGIVLGTATVTTLVLIGGLLIENRDAIQAALDTVYPGRRRSTGVAVSAGLLFAAPVLGAVTSTAQIVGSNASEVSSAFTAALAVGAILLIAQRRRPPAAALLLGIVSLFWLSWCLFSWGSFGANLPLANLVPPARAAEMVGIVASIFACLVLAHWRASSRWIAPLTAAAVVAGVSVLGGRSLADDLFPTLGTLTIVVAAVAAGVCAALLARFPGHPLPLALTVILLVAAAARVNPLEFGLGDLRDSPTAEALLGAGDVDRDAGTVWASDSLAFDSVMLSSAVPALSGRQQTGPAESEWRKLDPGARHERAWNRGGMYIRFVWNDALTPAFTNPTEDQVLIAMSPCELARREPRLRTVVSVAQLRQPCLRDRQQLFWAGQPHWVYDVAGPPPSP